MTRHLKNRSLVLLALLALIVWSAFLGTAVLQQATMLMKRTRGISPHAGGTKTSSHASGDGRRPNLLVRMKDLFGSLLCGCEKPMTMTCVGGKSVKKHSQLPTANKDSWKQWRKQNRGDPNNLYFFPAVMPSEQMDFTETVLPEFCSANGQERPRFAEGRMARLGQQPVLGSTSEGASKVGPHDCGQQTNMRSCHEVLSPVSSSKGVPKDSQIRACHWHLPNGPCEVIKSDYQDYLIDLAKNQSNYKNSDQTHDPKPRELLIHWATPFFGAIADNRADVQDLTCSRGIESVRCKWTSDIDYVHNNMGKLGAFIFHVPDLNAEFLPRRKHLLPWYSMSYEPPTIDATNDHVMRSLHSKMFNFKANYELDADFVIDYQNWNVQKEYAKKDGYTLFKQPLPYSDRRTDADAVWVATNCESFNERESVAANLMRHGVRTHSYGRCLHNKDFEISDDGQEGNFFTQLLSTYKFYFNFENCNCKHYFTEKLKRSLVLGVVPILLGHPQDVDKFLPHHDAAIKVWEYNSLSDMAKYIRKVAGSEELFNKHIKWKFGNPQDLNTRFLKHWNVIRTRTREYCAMCMNAWDLSTIRCAVPNEDHRFLTLPEVQPDSTCVSTHDLVKMD